MQNSLQTASLKRETNVSYAASMLLLSATYAPDQCLRSGFYLGIFSALLCADHPDFDCPQSRRRSGNHSTERTPFPESKKTVWCRRLRNGRIARPALKLHSADNQRSLFARPRPRAQWHRYQRKKRCLDGRSVCTNADYRTAASCLRRGDAHRRSDHKRCGQACSRASAC